MNKFLKSIVYSTLLAVAFALTGCTNVENGSVGVKIERYGDNRGVQSEVLKPGRYFIGVNTDVYSYPTFTKTETWTAPVKAGDKDESISFQIKGGTIVTGNFGVSLHIEPENVPKVFSKYRAPLEEISDTFLRNMVRDSLNDIAGNVTPDDLLDDRDGFMKKANEILKKRALEAGITVENLYAIGGFGWPQNIVTAMNAKTTATQNAIRVENELRSTEAENKKQVANAETALKVAELEAQATAVKGKALAANPNYIEQLRIEKWDGKYPVVVGSSSMINLPASALGK